LTASHLALLQCPSSLPPLNINAPTLTFPPPTGPTTDHPHQPSPHLPPPLQAPSAPPHLQTTVAPLLSLARPNHLPTLCSKSTSQSPLRLLRRLHPLANTPPLDKIRSKIISSIPHRPHLQPPPPPSPLLEAAAALSAQQSPSFVVSSPHAPPPPLPPQMPQLHHHHHHHHHLSDSISNHPSSFDSSQTVATL
jgi:hypothetical protein